MSSMTASPLNVCVLRMRRSAREGSSEHLRDVRAWRHARRSCSCVSCSCPAGTKSLYHWGRGRPSSPRRDSVHNGIQSRWARAGGVHLERFSDILGQNRTRDTHRAESWESPNHPRHAMEWQACGLSWEEVKSMRYCFEEDEGHLTHEGVAEDKRGRRGRRSGVF